MNRIATTKWARSAATMCLALSLASVEANAGSTHGPFTFVQTIAGHSSWQKQGGLKIGEVAIIKVIGGGSSIVSCVLYDSHGNYATDDIWYPARVPDMCLITFTPTAATGNVFTLKVHNVGPIAEDYVISGN